jgi:hypothetical protein
MGVRQPREQKIYLYFDLIVFVTSVPVLCIGCLRDKVLKIEYKHQDACDMQMSC